MMKVCLPNFNVKQKAGSSTDLKYVVHGAFVRCNCGSAPSSLIIPDRGYLTGLKLTAMDVDTKSVNFSSPFGKCKRTGEECVLALLPKWIEVDRRQNVGGGKLHPLLKKSKLVCFLGGVVSITDNGQQMASSSTEFLEDDYSADE